MREGKKKNVMVYLDPELVKEAKELGLNLSKVCENAIKEAIRRLKGENCQNILHSQVSDVSESDGHAKNWWIGRDLNPRPPECKSPVARYAEQMLQELGFQHTRWVVGLPSKTTPAVEASKQVRYVCHVYGVKHTLDPHSFSRTENKPELLNRLARSSEVEQPHRH